MPSASTAPPAIDVRDFRMEFNGHVVIERLDFQVQPGETFGLLGSNGSGKTTTLRALLGIYQPTGGELLVHGKPYQAGGGVRLGYLPEERGLYKREPVIDVMAYFGQLKGMDRGAATSWALDYLDRVGLADKSASRLDTLSGGQQQKVQLGVTIMNQPDVLILDEPTKGFDPVNQRLLMDMIAELQRSGTTLVLVSHDLEQVERLADRVLLLKDGEARAYGTVEEVQSQFGQTTLHVAYAGTLPASPNYRVLSTEAGYAELAVENGADFAAILRELVDSGLQVTSFEPRRTSLTDVFLEVYGADALREWAGAA